MGGGIESGCVGRVYGADGAVRVSKSKAITTPKTMCNSRFFEPEFRTTINLFCGYSLQ